MSFFHATCGYQGSPHSQLSEALIRKDYEDTTDQAQDTGLAKGPGRQENLNSPGKRINKCKGRDNPEVSVT